MSKRNKDFAVTCSIIYKLDNWLNTLAGPYLPPHRVSDPNGGFHWEFNIQNEYTFLIAKAVRMVSGIKASVVLADLGFVAESASILRLVSDFAIEITAIVEGIKHGQFNSAQQKCIDQFFEAPLLPPGKDAVLKKQKYVSREEYLKSLLRLANEASLNGEYQRNMKRKINRAYDGYVHGAYLTAMELYDGKKQRFITGGVYWPSRLDLAKVCIAGKLHEVVSALELMSRAVQNDLLINDIGKARKELDSSGEY